MPKIPISLTESELSTAISSLLFSCSVNVVSNTNVEFQTEMLELAKKLKAYNEEIKLDNIQFLKDDDYEDESSEQVFELFKDNMEIVTFEQL
jgi:hypothetical protein